jgi:hypothetical protein
MAAARAPAGFRRISNMPVRLGPRKAKHRPRPAENDASTKGVPSMAGFYGEVITRNSREVLFSIAARLGDAPKLGLQGQVWFPLACIQVTRDPETELDFLIVPTELALLRRSEAMAKDDLRRDDVDRYMELDQERKKLNRQVENLEREQKPLKEKILAFVQDNGGKTQAVSKWGYVLKINLFAGVPKWKDAFINWAGADEATKLSEAAPKQERLSVEKVEKAA